MPKAKAARAISNETPSEDDDDADAPAAAAPFDEDTSSSVGFDSDPPFFFLLVGAAFGAAILNTRTVLLQNLDVSRYRIAGPPLVLFYDLWNCFRMRVVNGHLLRSLLGFGFMGSGSEPSLVLYQ